MTDNIKKKLLGKYGEDYVKALIFTMAAEGAYSYRQADTGLQTYKGISRKWNPKWIGWAIVDKALEKYPELKIPYKKPPASIHKLNFELNVNEELEYLIYDFYYENYYTKCGAWNIGGKLAVVLFDMAVISGYKRSSKTLQKTLNLHFKTSLVIDSQVGSGTLKVLNEVIGSKGLILVVEKLIYEYQDNLIEASKLDGNEENYNGWMNRISHLSNYLRKL